MPGPGAETEEALALIFVSLFHLKDHETYMRDYVGAVPTDADNAETRAYAAPYFRLALAFAEGARWHKAIVDAAMERVTG